MVKTKKEDDLENKKKISFLEKNEKEKETIIEKLKKQKEIFEFELKNIKTKSEFNEGKLKENINLKSNYLELKDNYEFLKKEKINLLKKYQNDLFYTDKKMKNLNDEKIQIHKNERNLISEIRDLKMELKSSKDNFENLKYVLSLKEKDSEVKNKLLEKKNYIIENYENEIEVINKKTENFGRLMENLIDENQKLKLSNDHKNEKKLRTTSKIFK